MSKAKSIIYHLILTELIRLVLLFTMLRQRPCRLTQTSAQTITISLFCAGVDGLSHPPPALPTDSNFDSLFKTFTSFVFGSEENSGHVPPAESRALSGYQVSHCFDGVTVKESVKQSLSE